MPRRRHETTLQTVSDINVTPLMDLTFLLLIVFIITAPVLEYAVEVSPPHMQAETIDEEHSVMINLDAAGQILFEKEIVSPHELVLRLAAIQQAKPGTAVLIRADGSRPYRDVIDLMKVVRKANIGNVALVTQPEDDS